MPSAIADTPRPSTVLRRTRPYRSRIGPAAAALALVLQAALLGCAGAQGLKPPAVPVQPDTWTRALAGARDEARDCGSDRFQAAPPLRWSPRLAGAAAGHSRDMAGRERLGHLGSGGESLEARIEAAGYRARAWAENVAAGQPDTRAVVSAWLASPGHCSNIMRSAYRAFGAAMARAADGTPYWTLVLAAPRE